MEETMRGLIARTAAAVGAICVLAPGTAALADDAPVDPAVPPAPAATSTFTLPMLGVPLTVAVTTDAGGGLLDVALNPTDTYTAEHVRPNHVAFENTEGTVKVYVSAKHGGERVAVRSGALADISGASGWSGDVFGNGVPSSVGFTIAAGADGGPDITGIAVDSTLANTVGEVQRGSFDKWGGDWKWAAVEIRFDDAGQSRTLRIKASSGTKPDGEPSANLKISLGHVRGGRIAEGDAVGPHTWSGQLCDGTAASITYTVNADGSVSDVVATPEAQVGDWGHKTVVAFDRKQVVSIKVDDDDAAALEVTTKEWFNCGRNDPSVNTEVAPDATEPDNHPHDGWGNGNGWGHDGDHDHDGWRGDGRGNRDHDDDDD
jgi:hypothetical protein